MKSFFFLIFSLFFISCQQQEMNPSNEQSVESEVYVSDDDVDGAGGTEVVAKPNTVAPKYEAQNFKVFKNSFKIIFTHGSALPLEIAEIRLKGETNIQSDVFPNIVTTTHPELFDGETNNNNLYPNNGPLVVDFQTSENISLDQIEIYFNSSKRAISEMRVFYMSSELQHILYKASHLDDERANFFNATGATTFDLTYSNCSEPFVQNYNGDCYVPRVLCSDFNSEYEKGKFPCGIKRDGVEVLCSAVSQKSVCESKSSDLCNEAINYLTDYSQLYSLHFEELQIGSEVCKEQKSHAKYL